MNMIQTDYFSDDLKKAIEQYPQIKELHDSLVMALRMVKNIWKVNDSVDGCLNALTDIGSMTILPGGALVGTQWYTDESESQFLFIARDTNRPDLGHVDLAHQLTRSTAPRGLEFTLWVRENSRQSLRAIIDRIREELPLVETIQTYTTYGIFFTNLHDASGLAQIDRPAWLDSDTICGLLCTMGYGSEARSGKYWDLKDLEAL
jgi:hypothetical protein